MFQKLFALAMTLSLSAPSLSFGAEVLSGAYNSANRSIDLKLRYSGGCATHDFALELGGCAETMPVQCVAKLNENTHGDGCESIKFANLSFKLTELGMNEEYYSRASLTVKGDKDSAVSLSLPAIEESSNSGGDNDAGPVPEPISTGRDEPVVASSAVNLKDPVIVCAHTRGASSSAFSMVLVDRKNKIVKYENTSGGNEVQELQSAIVNGSSLVAKQSHETLIIDARTASATWVEDGASNNEYYPKCTSLKHADKATILDWLRSEGFGR